MAINPLVDISSQVQDITTSGGTGVVTSVTGAAPITSSGGTTPQIGLTIPLTVPQGGSGATTLTGYVKGNGVAAFSAQAVPIPVTDGGTGAITLAAGAYLKGNGAGAVATQATPIPIADGGTGAANLTGFILANGTNPLTANWNAGNFFVQSKNSEEQFDVHAYGAVGDGQVVLDGSMANGSNTLVCSSTTPFVVGDVGKIICVQGGAAAGATLVTTISGYSSASTVTLTLPNASGGAIAAKTVTWGTDDHVAIQSAITAAKKQLSPASQNVFAGGVVKFHGARYMMGANTLDLSTGGGYNGITLEGVGNMTRGVVAQSELIFTLTGATTCINFGGTSGNRVRGMYIRPENSAFTGFLCDLSAANTSDVTLEYNQFDSTGAGATTAINIANSNTVNTLIARNQFVGGSIYIQGGGNSVSIRENSFGQTGGAGPSTVAIKDPGQAWIITGNSFEPGATNQANGILCSVDTFGLQVHGNWMGDVTSTGAGQVWISVRGSGITIFGNFIGYIGGTAQNVTCIKCTNTTFGLSIRGNNLAYSLIGTGTVGFDGGGFAHVNLDLGDNALGGLTTVTGIASIAGGTFVRSGITARINQNSAQSLTSGVTTAITFDNTGSTAPTWNRGPVAGSPIWTSGSNTRFTVPPGCAGLWRITGQITYAGAAGGTHRGCYIKKNGTSFIGRSDVAQAGASATIVQCVATDIAVDGDYYEVYGLQDSGGAVNTLVADTGLTWAHAEKTN